MPKKIYDNWLEGLTPYSERVGPEGSYAEARDIDPHRSPGFIMPGWNAGVKLTSAGALVGLIVDALYWPVAGQVNVYGIDATKLYRMPAGTSITEDGDWPYTLASVGKGVVFFDCKVGASSAVRLFFIQDTDIGLSNPDTPDFDPDWLSTVPASGAVLSSGPHPYLKWKSFLWIGDQNNLIKIDGQTGDNGTITMVALGLPVGWEIITLFPTKNYIGVCAWYKHGVSSSQRTESKIFMFDGISSDYTYSIPIEDNKIQASFNDGGKVYLLTKGRSVGAVLRQLTEFGDEPIKILKTFVGGVVTSFQNISESPHVIDVFQNRILVGLSSYQKHNAIFAYGRPTLDFPYALTQPYSPPDDPSAGYGQIGMVKQLQIRMIYVSAKDDTVYYWLKFSDGNSANALLKEKYFDAGQKVRINYVEFYFKPLVDGDSVTVSLDTDYGTSNALGTLTYASDGAVTKKKFDKEIHGVEAHAFRPVVDWSAGGVAISKIVIDYDFVE